MKYLLIPLILLSLVFSSCVTMPFRSFESLGEELEQRTEIVEYAQGLFGQRNLTQLNRLFRNDCSGFVLGVYKSLGYRVRVTHTLGTRSATQAVYRSLRAKGLIYFGIPPKRGDVVFFKGTVDGMRNSISHMGMVTDILDDGTILIIHYSSKGVSLLRMNLEQPHVYKDENGQVKNDFLKRRSPRWPNEKLLSGQLFFSFGDLLRYTRRASTYS